MTSKERVKQARRESRESDKPRDLESMSVSELRERYREVFEEESHSRNRNYLIRRIAYRVQELAGGSLSERARERIEVLSRTAPIRRRPLPEPKPGPEPVSVKVETPAPSNRDPRLPPPGVVIHRTYKDVVHEVTVLDAGFEYRGEQYKSLSAIAKKICGAQSNGFAFFGLAKAREAA